MTNNLPAVQKTNWVDNDIVRPVHTNGWGEAINTLSEDLPIYASTGNYYNATMQGGSNVYVLEPANIEGVNNETVLEYLDGMTVVFKCPTTNSGAVYVNVNSLGVKSIKSSSNTDLTASTLIAGSFVRLIYDKTNGYFKYEQDTSKANISLNNLSSTGLGVINTTIDTRITSMLNTLYPVGSIYIGTQANCPLATLGIGTWSKIAGDKVLQSSSKNHAANTTINAGLPSISASSGNAGGHDHGGKTGSAGRHRHSSRGTSDEDDGGGRFTSGEANTDPAIYTDYADAHTHTISAVGNHSHTITLTPSVSGIYGNSSTVQPPAYVVNVWRRTA